MSFSIGRPWEFMRAANLWLLHRPGPILDAPTTPATGVAMNAHRALVLFVLPLQAVFAQVTPAGAARDAGRNRDLESRVEARRQELAMYVRSETQKRIE